MCMYYVLVIHICVFFWYVACSGDEDLTGVLYQPKMEHPTHEQTSRCDSVYTYMCLLSTIQSREQCHEFPSYLRQLSFPDELCCVALHCIVLRCVVLCCVVVYF